MPKQPMKRYTFCRLHIASGAVSSGEADAPDFCTLLKMLDQWNESAPTRREWKYWSNGDTGRFV